MIVSSTEFFYEVFTLFFIYLVYFRLIKFQFLFNEKSLCAIPFSPKYGDNFWISDLSPTTVATVA